MKPTSRGRIIRWIVLISSAVIVGLYLVLPIGAGVAAVIPGHATVGPPPAGFEAIELPTDDNISLAGWYAPPANEAAIILLHGAGGSREQVRPYADMLTRHGYGILALDLRGHGMSGGPTNRLGWQGSSDIGAALQYLRGREEVEQIGGLGLSMGGEVLLGAVSQCPLLVAVVADGATRRSTEELLALPSERPLYRNFTARVMFAAVQILSGDEPPKPLLESLIEAKSTTVLLIAGGANSLEVKFNELFADTIGSRATLWVAPDASHTAAFNLYPVEYEQRVISFFNRALLGDSTGLSRQGSPHD
jgi:uncharacterized protein